MERHAAEALAMTQSIPRKRPELLAETMPDAKTIDRVWTQLNWTVRQPVVKVVPRKGRHTALDAVWND
jgi:hypothetical protein